MALSGRSGYKGLLHGFSEIIFAEEKFLQYDLSVDQLSIDNVLSTYISKTAVDHNKNIEAFRELWTAFQNFSNYGDINTRFLPSSYTHIFDEFKDNSASYSKLSKEPKRLLELYCKLYRIAVSMDSLQQHSTKNDEMREVLIKQENVRFNIMPYVHSNEELNFLEQKVYPDNNEIIEINDRLITKLKKYFENLSQIQVQKLIEYKFKKVISDYEQLLPLLIERINSINKNIADGETVTENEIEQARANIAYQLQNYKNATYLLKKNKITALNLTQQTKENGIPNNNHLVTYNKLLRLFSRYQEFFTKQLTRLNQEYQDQKQFLEANLVQFSKADMLNLNILKNLSLNDKSKLKDETVSELIDKQTYFFPHKWNAYKKYILEYLLFDWNKENLQNGKIFFFTQIDEIIRARQRLIERKDALNISYLQSLQKNTQEINTLLSFIGLDNSRLEKSFSIFQAKFDEHFEKASLEAQNKYQPKFVELEHKYQDAINCLPQKRIVEQPALLPIPVVVEKPRPHSSQALPQESAASPSKITYPKLKIFLSILLGTVIAGIGILVGALTSLAWIAAGVGTAVGIACSSFLIYRTHKSTKLPPTESSVPTSSQPIANNLNLNNLAKRNQPSISSRLQNQLHVANLQIEDAISDNAGTYTFKFKSSDNLTFTPRGHIRLWKDSLEYEPEFKIIPEDKLEKVVSDLKHKSA